MHAVRRASFALFALTSACSAGRFPDSRPREDAGIDIDTGIDLPVDAADDAPTEEDADAEPDGGGDEAGPPIEPGPPVPPEPTRCEVPSSPRELVLAGPLPQPLVRLSPPAGIGMLVVGPVAPRGDQRLWTFPTTRRSDGMALAPGVPANNPTYALQAESIGAPGDDTTWGLRYGDDGSAASAITRTPAEISAGEATTLSPIAVVPSSRETRDARWAFVLEDNSTFTVVNQATWVASVRAEDPPLARESTTPVFGTAQGDTSLPAAALFDGRADGDSNLHVFSCTLSTSGDFSFPCVLLRVPPDQANDRAAYTAFVRDPDGSEHWESDLTKATTVLVGSSTLSVSWNSYLGQFLAAHSVFGSNELLLKTAPNLTGPWKEAARITLEAPPGGMGHNIFAREHSTLSPNCGQLLVVSYLEATSYASIYPTAGEPVLVTIALE